MPKKKVSSRKKRSTKAATQTPSTTSSTTAKTAKKKPTRKLPATKKKVTPAIKTEDQPADEEVATTISRTLSTATFLQTTDAPQILSQEIQYSYMTLLSRGASPAAACSQLGILLANVIWTLEQSPEFASMVERVQELLSQNVAAALYRSAMEGSVSAQQNYLKAYPPPPSGATDSDPMNDLELDLTEEELIEYLKAEAAAFLADFDETRPTAESPQAARRIPEATDPPGGADNSIR